MNSALVCRRAVFPCTIPVFTFNAAYSDYDSDPQGFAAFSQYGLDRLTAVTYPALGPLNTGFTPQITLTDRYSYTQAGLPAIKRLAVSETRCWITGAPRPSRSRRTSSNVSFGTCPM
jgi:hypothetical protein